MIAVSAFSGIVVSLMAAKYSLSSMRSLLFVIAALASGAAAAQDPGYSDAAARQLFEGARTAVLHDRPIATVRSLVFTGRVRAAAGSQESDGQVQIKVLLPDHYSRVDTYAGAERRSGFAGTRLLTPSGSLPQERARFTRMMLGVLAYAPPEPRLRLQSTGESGFADTEAVDVTGPAFTARLVFERATRVPMRLVFFGERQVSVVVSFANRRTVDGLELPSRITTQTPDRVLETLMFDEMIVNADLREDQFRQ
jgi:hypothetical protein